MSDSSVCILFVHMTLFATLYTSYCCHYRMPGNAWALDTAKHNLVNHYLLVGVTEDMGGFIAVLEATLPSFFRGATELYNSGT